MFALIPYGVWLAAAIAVGVELSAIAHHVGLAVVVAICLGSALILLSRPLATGSANRLVISGLKWNYVRYWRKADIPKPPISARSWG